METQQVTKSLRNNMTKINRWNERVRALFEGMLVLHPAQVLEETMQQPRSLRMMRRKNKTCSSLLSTCTIVPVGKERNGK